MSNIVGSPDLPSTSTMSTLDPARAAVTANAAVTVVFPTPPLPATMTTWEVEQKCATSIPACYERPMRFPQVRARAAAAAVLTLLAVATVAVGAGVRRGRRGDRS